MTIRIMIVMPLIINDAIAPEVTHRVRQRPAYAPLPPWPAALITSSGSAGSEREGPPGLSVAFRRKAKCETWTGMTQNRIVGVRRPITLAQNQSNIG